MSLKIQTWLNNKILRTIADEIVDFSEAKKLVKEMKRFLANSEDWVWLAATQVWIMKRIFLAQLDKKNVTILINPKILQFSDEKILWQEWCLSIPWVFWDVERSKEIFVEFYNLKWEKFNLKLKWFSAVVFQHELDHLDWILFFDKIVNWEFVMEEWVDLKGLWIDVL